MPRHPVSYVAVDVAAFTIADGELLLLVVERGVAPFRGALALPGGFVRPDEGLEDAARRELREETGIDEPVLEQLRSYGAPVRDPRARTVSVAHLAVLPEPVSLAAGTDAVSASWRAVSGVRDLAFDHDEIVTDAVERLASKLEYTALATAFLPEEFTLAELRGVYEVVWGRTLDAGNFQRKVRSAPDWVAPTGELRAAGRGRPAALFRAVKSGTAALDSPLVRSSW